MAPEEEIATFIRTERHLNKATKRIRAEALLPRLINGRLETSICRCRDIERSRVWLIAEQHFEHPPDLLAKAIGFGPAQEIYAVKLQFDPDGIPYSRHANIIGWNAAPLEKHAGKLQAQKIAAYFTYELDNRPRS